MKLNTRIAILKFAAATLLIIPGLIMITAPISPLIAWVEAFLDLAYQPFDGGERLSETSSLLLNAILGGILIGFGTMIWMVADNVFRNDRSLGRRLILIPIFCWFVTDSLGSILAGAWFNAVINVLILIMFLVPLLLPVAQSEGA